MKMRFGVSIMVFAIAGFGIALGGCGLLDGAGLTPGTYSGELACRATAVTAAGEEGQEDYTMAITLVVDEEGGLTVNDEPIEIGELVTRSMPNADLAFEVMTLSPRLGGVIVTYEPRPTLPGISVTGDLVEDYQQQADAVRVHGLAELVLTDVSGANNFEIDCSGTLEGE